MNCKFMAFLFTICFPSNIKSTNFQNKSTLLYGNFIIIKKCHDSFNKKMFFINNNEI